MSTKRGPLFQVAAAVLVALLAAATWYAWLGWDTQYDFDPVTSSYSGPYEAWQVAGCAVTLLIVLLGSVWFGTMEVVAAAALTVGFTTVWTVGAAGNAESGLFLIGAVTLLVGLGAASGAVSAIMFGLRNRRAPRIG
ncbi:MULTISPECIES: hypothetical protein [Actinoplanes]|uniref:hypothetical protein n=1 Tax=Actinoplanes TaxID=1865 RepID=UPI0005F2CBBE|nr:MULTISPECIES: hypothetical protein [Actinoplanes]GLY05478.1 hypothetical protein Acsp01_58570 [Actinoplanes sp. NBRC 101535]